MTVGDRPPARSLGSMVIGLGRSALSLAILIGLWAAYIRIANLDPYFAKSPSAVWQYLFGGGNSTGHRSVLIAHTVTTIEHAAIGYGSGIVCAILISSLFILSRTLERSLMPLVLVFLSVPLVALTPLIVLMFGRGLLAVAIVGAIVTFFPTLVYAVEGFRSLSRETMLLMSAFGARSTDVLWKARIPSALPSLFAGARIAAPATFLGAVLVEYLATGNGLGYLMLRSSTSSQFALLWSAVVVVTGASLLLYTVVGWIEMAVLKQLGMSAAQAH